MTPSVRPLAPWRRLIAIAFIASVAGAACGSGNATSTPGVTIDLRPSSSAGPSGPPSAQRSATAAPSSVLPSLALPSATPLQTAGGPSLAPATPSVPASLAPATPGVPASIPAPAALAWSDCGVPFECATMQVPLDYTQPLGRQITLALTRLPAADPGRRIGALLINPGGPGASGIDFTKGSAEALFPQSVRDRFDIVGFDPRGVGASTPVECLNGPDLDRLNAIDPTPDTPAERDAVIAAAHQFDDACVQHSADLVPYMSTADAARDMDQMRRALGEAKLTYFGFSYGTFLGTVYAGLFPQNIRALVLDGALDPTQTFVERMKSQAQGFSRALNAFLNDCKAHPTCKFFNNGHPAEAFDALMAQIDAKPIPAIARPDQDGRLIGPGEAFTGVLQALYARSLWGPLAQGLALAQRGDGWILLALADLYNERNADGTYTNLFAANNAVNCLDYQVPTDIATYDALVPVLEQDAPHFGAAIAYGGLTCAFWPVHPARDPGEITAVGAPPILVVGTTGDPATPYEGAVRLSRELSSAVLLTRVGEGHTAYGESTCIDDIVNQYLLTLKAPPADTTCQS